MIDTFTIVIIIIGISIILYNAITLFTHKIDYSDAELSLEQKISQLKMQQIINNYKELNDKYDEVIEAIENEREK
tara:strand:+ start:869 stop:1093 length:225 start_codon:yes stop_codon:yes gene_type:complete